MLQIKLHIHINLHTDKKNNLFIIKIANHEYNNFLFFLFSQFILLQTHQPPVIMHLYV